MEQDTLYINIQIEKEKLDTFFAAKPALVNIDDNWQQWWSSREMYSKTALKAVPAYPKLHNREVVHELLKDSFFGAAEKYDEGEQRWTFAAINFSENYYEILPMLTFLMQLGSYTNSGHALIYDWMWGDETVMAFVEFRAGQAWLEMATEHAQIAPDILEEADSYLQALSESLYAKGKGLS